MKISINIGVPTLLAIIFTTLKLCGVIAWSWVWVLSPLWIMLAGYFLLFLIFFVIEFWLGD